MDISFQVRVGHIFAEYLGQRVFFKHHLRDGEVDGFRVVAGVAVFFIFTQHHFFQVMDRQTDTAVVSQLRAKSALEELNVYHFTDDGSCHMAASVFKQFSFNF